MVSAPKKVTMYTIAEELGVSVAAVSRAFDPNSQLKPQKRQIILETAERLGYVPNKMASRLSGAPIRIGVLIYGSIAAYYNEYIEGIHAAHAEFVDYKIDLDLHLLEARKHSIEEAYAVLDHFCTGGYGGVIISGLCKRPHLERLNQLSDSNVRFIIMDTDLDGCKRDGVAMNDVTTAAKMAAQLLRCAMGDGGDVAVFAGSVDNLSQQSLLSAFRSAAEGYGNRIAALYHTENDPEMAEQAVCHMMENYPNIAGIYVSTANSIPICRAIEQAGLSGRIKMVTSDIFTELNECIRRGTVFATIYQNPFSQAHDAFEELFFHLVDKSEIREFILAKPLAVLESNLNLYEKT